MFGLVCNDFRYLAAGLEGEDYELPENPESAKQGLEPQANPKALYRNKVQKPSK